MELNGFKSEDYIYLRVYEDFTIVTSSYSYDSTKYTAGQILRFKKEDLDNMIFSRHLHQILGELEFVSNPECDVNAIMPYDTYSKIYFKGNAQRSFCLWPKETYFLGPWLSEKLTSDDRPVLSIFDLDSPPTKVGRNLASIKNSPATIDEENHTLTVGKSNINLSLDFKAGEELDFRNPDIAILFLDHNTMRLLSHCETITGEEKQALFVEDFTDAFIDKERPDSGYEYRYYKLNSDIKVKTLNELSALIGNLSINISDNPIDYDEDGYVRYVYIKEFLGSTTRCSKRSVEESILKIATRVPVDIAKEHLETVKRAKEEERKRYEQALLIERAKKKAEINRLYSEKIKDDASIFPGANGNFVHTSPYNISDPNASIEEVREFYKRLKELNESILKKMYFYGGTIPYIMTNAQNCRDFGDVDIFVPISMMSYLREELEKQPSFYMRYDSKGLTKEYNLTSRVYKNELERQNPSERITKFLTIASNPDINNTVDENGRNILTSFFDNSRPYNQVAQDFGFKGVLFGIKISVFPLYNYGNNLMAKSFNIRDLYQFLLGVRVMNNTKLEDFAKTIDIYSTPINIIPLEYTIVSKESAIKNGYLKRSEKDAEDLAYIKEHSTELGISEDKISQIATNYPDYSIAIAYALQDGRVETINGEYYRELVLKHNGRVIS